MAWNLHLEVLIRWTAGDAHFHICTFSVFSTLVKYFTKVILFALLVCTPTIFFTVWHSHWWVHNDTEGNILYKSLLVWIMFQQQEVSVAIWRLCSCAETRKVRTNQCGPVSLMAALCVTSRSPVPPCPLSSSAAGYLLSSCKSRGLIKSMWSNDWGNNIDR